MADKDRGATEGPSLELPSLFGRTKKSRAAAATKAPAAEAAPETPPAETTPEPPADPSPEPDGQPDGELDGERAGRAARVPRRRARERTTTTVPALPPSAAAALVGAVVGGLGVLLTFLGLRGCEAVRGTDSCGGPGLFVLVAIVVLMVLAGAWLLRQLRVPEPGNLSFLGVGILSVVVLLFLIDQLFETWAQLAIPVLGAASYAVARWVTTRYADLD